MLEQELRSLWSSLLKDWDMQESDLQVSDKDDYHKFTKASSFRCAFREKVNQKYGIELDVVTFVEEDFSIENLARIVEKEPLKSSRSKKTEVNNKNPPFFLFPSILGDGPEEYRNLIAELKKMRIEHPIHPFKAPGLINPSDAQLNTQQLIDHYFQLLKRAQPIGPYYLGGWSSGAFIAYGIAQKLRENNDEVRYLALIDEAAPPLSPDNYDPNIFANELLELVKHLPADFTREITHQELTQKSCKEQVEYVFTHFTPRQNMLPKAEDTLTVVKGFLLGMLQHQFKPAKDVNIQVFYTDKTLANNQNKQHLNWDLYGKVTSERVGENHFSPILQPAKLIENITKQLESLDGRIIQATSSSTTNTGSSETTEALIQKYNLIIQENIALCLNSPCNVLTVLQLLQKFMEWYTSAHDMMACFDINIRMTYKQNEIIFNAAILSIVKDLKTKSLADNTIPSWLNEWLAEVESFTKKELAAMNSTDLLKHTVAIQAFMYKDHNEQLEKLSNPDNNILMILTIISDNIRKIKKISDKFICDKTKQYNKPLPLYTTLATQANLFGSNIRKKQSTDFIYKPDDLKPKVKM